MASGAIKHFKTGAFNVELTSGLNSVTSADLMTGTLPSDMIHCVYSISGYSTDTFNAQIHPASDNSKLYIMADRNCTITVRWTELF